MSERGQTFSCFGHRIFKELDNITAQKTTLNELKIYSCISRRYGKSSAKATFCLSTAFSASICQPTANSASSSSCRFWSAWWESFKAVIWRKMDWQRPRSERSSLVWKRFACFADHCLYPHIKGVQGIGTTYKLWGSLGLGNFDFLRHIFNFLILYINPLCVWLVAWLAALVL